MHLTSFDVLITARVIRPNCRTFCWLCSSGIELKNFSRVQRRKYVTIVNICIYMYNTAVNVLPSIEQIGKLLLNRWELQHKPCQKQSKTIKIGMLRQSFDMKSICGTSLGRSIYMNTATSICMIN